ncbi:MAG: hypothetical protein GYB66_13205 [Chloroflexi bacterium]|nr:hypothetical protein [Chloroflexota bacterium]
MAKRRKAARTAHKPQEERPRVDMVSLMIAAVALAVFVLFFFPWLTGDENLSGLDVASRNLAITEDFPSGVVFILPLVAGSILFQYYRRVRDAVRPRRRLATLLTLIVGLIATGLWVRTYTIKATDFLNDQPPPPTSLDDVLDPGFSAEDRPLPPQQEPYTTGDVLREQFTTELWLHLALGASLLILPFLDTRPPADPPEY